MLALGRWCKGFKSWAYLEQVLAKHSWGFLITSGRRLAFPTGSRSVLSRLSQRWTCEFPQSQAGGPT